MSFRSAAAAPSSLIALAFWLIPSPCRQEGILEGTRKEPRHAPLFDPRPAPVHR